MFRTSSCVFVERFRTPWLLVVTKRPNFDGPGSQGLIGLQSHNGETFYRLQGYCRGFHEVLQVYTAITPGLRLNGPTNFAPLIYQAIDIVKSTRAVSGVSIWSF